MPKVGQLTVELTAETVKFTRPLQDATRDLESLGKKAQDAGASLEKFSRRAADIGRSLSLTVTAPIAAIGGAAIKMAMDAVESENLFEVSMGKMAGAARQFSEELRQQFGLNAYEVRRQVGTFNVMFTSMGIGEKAAYGMAAALTKLTYDMASLYNLRTEDAFLKLQAAISGEIEPLRRLGVVVNETTIQQYALREGLIKQGETLSETGKIYARFGVIMEQMGKAHGDLARTIDSPTNQLRILQSELKQAAIDLGMALLPVVQNAMPVVRDLADQISRLVAWFASLSPASQETIVKLTALAAACGPIALALSGISKVAGVLVAGIGALIAFGGKLIFAFSAWAGGAATFGEALTLVAGGPIGVIVLALGGLVAAGIAVYKNWDTVRHYGLQAWGYIKAGVLDAVDKMLAAMEKWIGWIPVLGQKIKDARSAIQPLLTQEIATISARAAQYEADQIAKQAQKAKDSRSDFQKQADAMRAEMEKLLQSIMQGGVGTAAAEKATKSQRTAVDILKDLSKQLRDSVELEKAFGNEFDLNRAKTDAYRKAIEDLINLGLTPHDKAVKQLIEKYQALSNEIEKASIAAILQDMTISLQKAAEKEELLGDAFDLNAEKAKIFARTMELLIDAGLKATDPKVQDVFKRWQAVQALPSVSVETRWRKARDYIEKLIEGMVAPLNVAQLRIWEERQVNQFKKEQEDKWRQAVEQARSYIEKMIEGLVPPQNLPQFKMWDEQQVKQYQREQEGKWEQAAQRAKDTISKMLEGLVSPQNLPQLRMWDQQQIAGYLKDQEALRQALVEQAHGHANLVKKGLTEVTSFADRILLESVTEDDVKAAERIAGEVINKSMEEARQRWSEVLYNLTIPLKEAADQAKAIVAGETTPIGFGQLKLLEWGSYIQEAKKNAEEDARRGEEKFRTEFEQEFKTYWQDILNSLYRELQLAMEHVQNIISGRAAPVGFGQLKLLEYSTTAEQAVENSIKGQAEFYSEWWQETLQELTPTLGRAEITASEILSGIREPVGAGQLKLLEYTVTEAQALVDARKGEEKYRKEAWEETLNELAVVIREAQNVIDSIKSGQAAPIGMGQLKILEYSTTVEEGMAAAVEGAKRWREEARQTGQQIINLVDAFTVGLSTGLDDAGTAWGDFMSVVVSSIKLTMDETGNIISVDWKQTLVSIANYGLNKLGQAIANLFTGADRLRQQYPYGSYGEVNYPDLARMRENYQNWEQNLQKLQQAQQAQATMTVGGGLLGGLFGFLIGGPIGALIGAGLGAGAGYAAGQAIYGKQIEELKKKLEDTFQKIAETLGTTISNVADALGNAFSAETYQEFLNGFATNLESVVKQALIKAFMAGEAMRPLLQGLSDFITVAVWDGTLDAAEKLKLAEMFQQIVGVAQPFWEALQEFDFAEAVGAATDALGEFSEALRNVPTGFKITAARWDVALPAYQEGGTVGRTGVAVLHAGETVIPAGEVGGIHVHLEGATIYGMDDFERKVEAAVSKATRRAGLGYRGLARAGAY